MTQRWHLTDTDKIALNKTGYSWGYFCRQEDMAIDSVILQELKAACFTYNQPSVRLCVHSSPQALLHEMIIVERPISYFPPHKHKCKGETVHILEGELAAILYEADGRIREVHILQPGNTMLLRLSKDTFHFYMPLTDCAIYYESKLGPYCAEDNLFAPWAPARTDLERAVIFKQDLAHAIQAERSRQ